MKTAVEWLFEQIDRERYLTDNEMYHLINQAKEMEKKQIIDAHIDGFYSPPFRKSRRGEAKQYYNETFKSE